MARFTDKQRAFIDHYIKTLNGLQSAKHAKYKGNDATLAAVAYENLRKPHIRAEIDKRLKELSITDDEILFRLQKQATADLGDVLDRHGIIDIDKLINTGVIKKYKVTKQGREIEFYDAQAALIHLFKLRRLMEGKPTAIIKLQEAIEQGKITKEQAAEKWPALVREYEHINA